MFAQMKHLAIVSENYALLGRFYEAVFRMRTSGRARPEGAVVVGDGYVGVNINPRRAGRQAGFDHFGFEVEDVEKVFSRLKAKYPAVHVLKRPGNRPFAGLSTHDPAGNVFDLSQRGMENRTDVYEDAAWKQDRTIHHFALRAVNPEPIAQFYLDLFELQPLEKPRGDPNFYLSDGRVIFMVMPWSINDYQGSGIERPALDHIGFKVENIEGFKRDLQAITERNPSLSARTIGLGPEGQARLSLFEKCPYGKFHIADLDGVMIDVCE